MLDLLVKNALLGLVGGADSVGVLSDLLDKPSLAESARQALHKMPGEAVDRALVRAAREADVGRRVDRISPRLFG